MVRRICSLPPALRPGMLAALPPGATIDIDLQDPRMHDARAAGDGTSSDGDYLRGLPLRKVRDMALRCAEVARHECAGLSNAVAAMTQLTS